MVVDRVLGQSPSSPVNHPIPLPSEQLSNFLLIPVGRSVWGGRPMLNRPRRMIRVAVVVVVVTLLTAAQLDKAAWIQRRHRPRRQEL